MIAQFALENYKSFLERTTIDFSAGTTSRLRGNLLRHRNRERFVKSMALYGPNASGKTTILDGLYSLRKFVRFSSHDQIPTSRIPLFEPFALDQTSSKAPTQVSITIDIGADRYKLDVSVTAERVWRESLDVQHISKQPTSKSATTKLIERVWEPSKRAFSVAIHPTLGTELTRRAVEEQTTPNRMLLGKLASMNSDIPSRIVQWFDADISFYDMHRNPGSEAAMLEKAARLLKQDSTFSRLVERFTRDADIGISELKVVDQIAFRSKPTESENTFELEEITKPGLSFRHSTKDGSDVIFQREQESSGTLRFVALLSAILRPSPRRRLVCADELSASLHPELVRRLIRLVHSREYNPNGHQLLFTTHDTHLIDPSELLRRDQITLCRKNRFGQSSASRLDEFQDGARSDANLQKQYLEGRFGGIPLFGPSLEDVPLDDEPLEIS